MPDNDFFFGPTPHEAAIATIKGKSPVKMEVFENLLPELRARAFAVAGIESFDVLETIRDRIAELPAGGDWNEIKKELVKDLTPYLTDPDAAGEDLERQVRAAERRAELLIRTHGFQAYQQAAWEEMDEQRDVFPYWQYQSMGDHKVRATHAALDGLVLPEGSPFWQGHFPPWEWGCRCQVIPLMDIDVEEMREADAELPPERRRVLEGQALKDAESGRLVRGPNEIYDLSTPRERQGDKGYHWNPADARLSIEQIKERYSPEVWSQYEDWAKSAKVDDDTTVWDWMGGKKPVPTERSTGIKSAEDLQPEFEKALKIANPIERVRAFHAALALPEDERGEYFHRARVNKPSIDRGFDFVSRITHRSLAPKERVGIKQRRKRAAVDPLGRGINGKGMIPSTVAHELGHILECRNPDLLKKAVAFRDSRTKENSPEPFGKGFRKSEQFLRDLWKVKGGDHYIGKLYQTPAGENIGSEIISSGMERLMRDPAGFFQQDPEYFNFMVNALRGK